MGRRLIALLILFASCTSAAAGSFRLEEIAHNFDAKGFEEPIRFWVDIFAKYGEKDYVFHDRFDLGIIYDVVVFERAAGKDEKEQKRQREVLENRAKALKAALGALAEGEGEKDNEQKRIAALLASLGHPVTTEFCERLSDQIRFQRGIKEKFREGIIRSGRYLAEIERIFQREGLPRELALMPHVESSFEYFARSKAGAQGIWQFVHGTGRLYLKINRNFDERLDPIKATEAAARLLKENYEALGSWPLAIVAYNHGRNGMLRAKARFGTDMLRITKEYESRSFGFASRNFYPEFLAAVLVARNYEDYFGPLTLLPPIRYETALVEEDLSINSVARSTGMSPEQLRQFNPHVSSRVWDRKVFPAGMTLRVPPGAPEKLASLASASAEPASSKRDEPVRYTVRKGDTLQSIARSHGVKVSSLEAANRLRDRDLIHPGQTLAIPSSESPTRYRVQRGDTLQSIARRFQVSLNALAEVNSISNPHRILLGQVLLIPMMED